jgi:hypothetical protein
MIQPRVHREGVDMFTAFRTNSSPRATALSVFAVFLALPAATDVALAQEGVIGWGDSVVDSRCHEQSFVEVEARESQTVARRSDGSVVAWGTNYYGQCTVPALPPGVSYVEVAAGLHHTVARRSDGSVVAWGFNSHGECNVPPLPPGLSYVGVAAGGASTLARRSDGSVVAWGDNNFGQCNVPALPPGLTLAQISAGLATTVAILRAGAYATFGAGCPGSTGVTHLEATTLPRVGGTMTVRVEPMPLFVAVMISGFSNVSWAAVPLPIDLSSLGLTNCSLRVSLDANDALIGSLGSATYSLGIPASPALAGFMLHQQAVVLDPAAGNPAGLVMSDAATAVVGM